MTVCPAVAASPAAGFMLQRRTTPSLRTSAVKPSTAAGASPARTAAAFEGPADRPLLLPSSTKYVSERAGPAANAAGSVSVKLPCALGAKNRSAGTAEHTPDASLRQTRTGVLPLISSLSVVFFGIVQLSET